MTLILICALAVAALAPLAWTLRGHATLRSRRDTALAVHRAQLAELDRDHAEARIADPEHAAATLELQRRLLAAADTQDAPAKPARAGRAIVLAALFVIPLAGALLYLREGHPDLQAVPLAERRAAAAEETQKSEALITQLRQRLTTLDPHSDIARQGYILLGNAEDSLGHLAAAAEAWRTAVAIRFDPVLAAQAAEAQTRVDGKVTSATADLFRRALAEAPPNAPWRDLVEQRLHQAAQP